MKIVLFLMAAAVCFAQEDEHPKYYRVDFTVKEVEAGKTISSRDYGMTVTALSNGSIRTGDKVPVPASKDGSFTFIDVGVNIDWIMQRSTSTQVQMKVTADVSNVASEKPGSLPVINQTKSSSTINVPVGKATNVFAADGATTRRQMQMDVTVTPVP
jgi:hypothetical protein